MTSLDNSTSFRFLSDRIFIGILWALAMLGTSIVGLIIYFLITESIPFFLKNGIFSLFSDLSWNPTEGLYNLAPMLIGSLLIMTGSVLLAAPLGIASAVFCRFYSTTFISNSYRKMIQLLAGIPSVVFGFWGLVELVPVIRQLHSPGVSLIAGILVVALMILPTITLIVDASF